MSKEEKEKKLDFAKLLEEAKKQAGISEYLELLDHCKDIAWASYLTREEKVISSTHSSGTS